MDKLKSSESNILEAIKAFQEKRMNCAQSVLYAFQRTRGISDEKIISAKAMGGGRAAEGRCGALQAAIEITETTEQKISLRRAFAEKAGGYEQCADIKRKRVMSCIQCVELAAKLLNNLS